MWLTLLTVFAEILFVRQVSLVLVRLRRSKQWKCGIPRQMGRKDPIFGLDFQWERIQAHRQNRLAKFIKSKHDTLGETFKCKTYLYTSTYTIDVENIKSIYATNDRAWIVEPLRLFAMGPLLDKGIMASDGTYWKQSRTLVRSLFTREQIFQPKSLQRRVSNLLKLIPKDGSTFDLQDLFAKFTFDGAMEFYFGKNLNSTVTGTKATQSLLQIYSKARAVVGRRVLLPHLNILTDKEFWTHCDQVQAFINQSLPSHESTDDWALQETGEPLSMA